MRLTPKTIVGLCGSVRIATERGSGIVLMPPSLTFILADAGAVEYFSRTRATCDSLQTDVGEVLRARVAALGGLQTLCGNTHLQDSTRR